MSDNVVSREFQFPDSQMLQLGHSSDRVDLLTAEIPKQMIGHVSHNAASLHFVASYDQMGPLGHMPNSSGFPNLVVSHSQMRQMEPQAGIVGAGGPGIMQTNLGLQTSSLPFKRKAEMEPSSNYSVPQQVVMSNKRAAHMGTSPNSQSLQPLAPHRKPVQTQSKLSSSIVQNLPTLNKKFVRNESGKSGPQKVQTPKGRTMQIEPVSKVQTESYEAVRSKMREQLAAALALASQNQDKSPNTLKNQVEESSKDLIPSETQRAASDSNAVVARENKLQQPKGTFPSSESGSLGKSDDSQELSAELSTSKNTETREKNCKEFPCSTILPEDVSFSDNFFVKDDLLQGNGLSWALDLDMGATEVTEGHSAEKPELAHDNIGEDASKERRPSPQNLALEIESELFKLFGGVNKKYKEKGRSLLFNLKDRSNPELRERVVSGEITPEKLCSMTAEELASKELSEWRVAKAEELAQMVVLPDTDFDRRRLVKKTHKGEYQVELEQDDSNVMGFSVGASLTSQTELKSKEIEANPSSESESVKDKEKIVSENNSSENQDVSGSLVITSDGTDLMQGIMVDELKDVEFLPPIISLDEFMESLNSEPPFENLQANGTRSTPTSGKESSESHSRSAASDSASKNIGDTPSVKDDEAVTKQTVDTALKSGESPSVQKISPVNASSRIEHIWAGTLQLNISSFVTTFGVFKSGEKTSTAEWPSSMEIKGRVRLDAFEKFMKELPMSRSRAVMVLHFLLKDKTSESERASLHEAVDSYVSDERLGFAEPAPGIELYLCPPHKKILGLLGYYLSDDQADILNSTDNGLIGVVVWRKAHISSVLSPNSSSHHKHSMKRQHFTSRRQQEKEANVNVNSMPKVAPPSHNRYPPAQPPPEDDDSDIPPGFGPPAGREDDDLPEFNFSGNANPAMSGSISNMPPQGSRVASFNSVQVPPSRPVDQIRQLIHKYGQTDSSVSNRTWSDNRGSRAGLGIEPWNDEDEDDDIPEWRPQGPPQLHQLGHAHTRSSQLSYGNQHFVPTVAQQQHLNPALLPSQSQATRHQGAEWVQSPANTGNQPSGGQYYRTPVMQAGKGRDGSRTRGY